MESEAALRLEFASALGEAHGIVQSWLALSLRNGHRAEPPPASVAGSSRHHERDIESCLPEEHVASESPSEVARRVSTTGAAGTTVLPPPAMAASAQPISSRGVVPLDPRAVALAATPFADESSFGTPASWASASVGGGSPTSGLKAQPGSMGSDDSATAEALGARLRGCLNQLNTSCLRSLDLLLQQKRQLAARKAGSHVDAATQLETLLPSVDLPRSRTAAALPLSPLLPPPPPPQKKTATAEMSTAHCKAVFQGCKLRSMYRAASGRLGAALSLAQQLTVDLIKVVHSTGEWQRLAQSSTAVRATSSARPDRSRLLDLSSTTLSAMNGTLQRWLELSMQKNASEERKNTALGVNPLAVGSMGAVRGTAVPRAGAGAPASGEVLEPRPRLSERTEDLLVELSQLQHAAFKAPGSPTTGGASVPSVGPTLCQSGPVVVARGEFFRCRDCGADARTMSYDAAMRRLQTLVPTAFSDASQSTGIPQTARDAHQNDHQNHQLHRLAQLQSVLQIPKQQLFPTAPLGPVAFRRARSPGSPSKHRPTDAESLAPRSGNHAKKNDVATSGGEVVSLVEQGENGRGVNGVVGGVAPLRLPSSHAVQHCNATGCDGLPVKVISRCAHQQLHAKVRRLPRLQLPVLLPTAVRNAALGSAPFAAERAVFLPGEHRSVAAVGAGVGNLIWQPAPPSNIWLSARVPRE